MPIALITGAMGQDGRWLADLLFSKGYQVHGTSRGLYENQSSFAHAQIFAMHQLSLDQPNSINELIKNLQPDEIYHLAARSSSSQLADDPIQSAQINGLSALYFLDAIKNYSSRSKFCFASSSEVFAETDVTPQSEQTVYAAINPYGISKVFAMNWVRHYRKVHGLFASSAILYNHESIYRGIEYVTRKITSSAASIYLGKTQSVNLGSLESQRDWMHARDAVRGMWLMLQNSWADDFVFGTGILHSVRDVCEVAFSHLGLDYRRYVTSQVDMNRRQERTQLCAEIHKAQKHLKWQPEIDFTKMIQEMVDFDLHLLTNSNTSR